MPIQLECPGCSKQFRVADEHAGKRVKCPGCQTIFQVPQAESPADEQATSSPQSDFIPRPVPRDSGAGHSGAGDFAPGDSALGDVLGQANAGSSNYPGQSASPSPYQPSQHAAASYQPAGPPGPQQTMGQVSLVLGIVALVGEVILPVIFLCCCGAGVVIIPAAMTIPAGIGLAMSFKAEGGLRTAAMIVNSIALVIGVLAILALIALFVLYGALIFQAQQQQQGGGF